MILEQIKSRHSFGRLLNDLNLDSYGAELGVGGGGFSDKILSTSNLDCLYSIDIWDSSDPLKCDQYMRAITTLKKYNKRNVIIRDMFENAVKLFNDEMFDFVYVDGFAHTGQDNGTTLYQWWSKVKQNGIFAGHDYHPKWPKNVEWVDKFADEYNLDLLFTDSDQYPSWYAIKT